MLALLALFASSQGIAHPAHEPLAANHPALASCGTPSSDNDKPLTQTIGGLTDRTKTQSIVSIKELGIIDLGEEFPAMLGRQMHARIFVFAPGGVIAINAHEQRPGSAMVLGGSIVEHRNDAPGPIVRKVGDIAIEKSGVVHWWENVSGDAVKALVVDIVGAE